MGAKQQKSQAKKMDKQEFLYNKGLLKEINDKKKSSIQGSAYDGASRLGSNAGM